jgi:hypothetical protein
MRGGGVFTLDRPAAAIAIDSFLPFLGELWAMMQIISKGNSENEGESAMFERPIYVMWRC